MADKMDFEAKQLRMARRKQWLKRNQQLLRTLLTYCSLYGASGGGLACIKMELILLLQVRPFVTSCPPDRYTPRYFLLRGRDTTLGG